MNWQSNIFPVEIFYSILSFSGPLDVIRWRVVSKQFRDITYESSIWRRLYSTARIPLPPGPFSHQSVQFLEQNLVRSTKLSQTWTTKPMKDVARRDMVLPAGPVFLFGGRWSISLEPSCGFVLKDLDSEMRASQVLLRLPYAGSIRTDGWHACSLVCAAGWLIYVLVWDAGVDTGVSLESRPESWKLYEFRLDADSGEVHGCASWDVPLPIPVFSLPIEIYHRKGPFLYIRSSGVLFDTRTKHFHDFFEFRSPLDPTLPGPGGHFYMFVPASWAVFSTDTQIIVFWCRQQYSSTIVQVFDVPVNPEQSNLGTYPLHLSSEAMYHPYFRDIAFVPYSTVDPDTGSTTLRFLQVKENRNLHFMHSVSVLSVNVTLPRSRPDTSNNLSIRVRVRVHEVFTLGVNESHRILKGYRTFLENAQDGYIRGCCFLSIPATVPDPLGTVTIDEVPSFLRIVKFAIDATGEKVDVTVGRPSVQKWTRRHVDGLPIERAMWFDGVRGRIWYTVNDAGGNREVGVVVLDVE